MEEWSKNFFEALETAATEIEELWTEVSTEFTEFIDACSKLSEELSQEMQEGFMNEIDQWFSEIFDPVIEFYLDVVELEVDPNLEELESIGDPFVGYVHPTVTQHSACRGCRNYHGQVYGGNLLVCAMHPSGVEDDTCPDWESRSDRLEHR